MDLFGNGSIWKVKENTRYDDASVAGWYSDPDFDDSGWLNTENGAGSEDGTPVDGRELLIKDGAPGGIFWSSALPSGGSGTVYHLFRTTVTITQRMFDAGVTVAYGWRQGIRPWTNGVLGGESVTTLVSNGTLDDGNDGFPARFSHLLIPGDNLIAVQIQDNSAGDVAPLDAYFFMHIHTTASPYPPLAVPRLRIPHPGTARMRGGLS